MVGTFIFVSFVSRDAASFSGLWCAGPFNNSESHCLLVVKSTTLRTHKINYYPQSKARGQSVAKTGISFSLECSELGEF